MRYDCLIVDDETALAEATAEYFTMFGLTSAYVESAEECLAFLSRHTVSLILLDINLGDSSGFSLCKKLRETTSVPILFVSARTSDDDILVALNIGGDDYIKKPYTLSVLLAKVKAVLRRYCAGKSDMLQSGNIRVDVKAGRAYLEDKDLELKTMELKLLKYLVENPERLLTKEELFQKVWENSFPGDGTLNVHIRRLREKIEEDAARPKRIQTVWGVGYLYHEK